MGEGEGALGGHRGAIPYLDSRRGAVGRGLRGGQRRQGERRHWRWQWLGRGRAAVVVELREGSAGPFIGGQVGGGGSGAGERDGIRRRVAGGAV